MDSVPWTVHCGAVQQGKAPLVTADLRRPVHGAAQLLDTRGEAGLQATTPTAASLAAGTPGKLVAMLEGRSTVASKIPHGAQCLPLHVTNVRSYALWTETDAHHAEAVRIQQRLWRRREALGTTWFLAAETH